MTADPTQLHSRAISLLARREHSRLELQQKLTKKGFDPEQIPQELDQLTKDGYQCDTRFTEAYIRMRTSTGNGPIRIKSELKERGIADALIKSRLEEGDQHWINIAKQVREKRFGPEKPQNFTEKSKQMRFLQYRGFTQEQINQQYDN